MHFRRHNTIGRVSESSPFRKEDIDWDRHLEPGRTWTRQFYHIPKYTRKLYLSPISGHDQ
jgi:hypothetical protein